MNRQIQRLLQDPASRHFEALTIGYLVALNGFQEPAEMSDSDDYRRGHAMGTEALNSGKLPMPFLGYCPDEEMPLKRGQEITIPKGVKVHHRGKVTVSTRARKIQIHHFISGTNLHIRKDHHREDITHVSAPRVVWPGSGGYWSEVDINDIPEAVEAAKTAQRELDQQAQKVEVDLQIKKLSTVFSEIRETVASLTADVKGTFTFRCSGDSPNFFQAEAVLDDAVLAKFVVDTYCEAQKVIMKIFITSSICQPLTEAVTPFLALGKVMAIASEVDAKHCQPWNQGQ